MNSDLLQLYSLLSQYVGVEVNTTDQIFQIWDILSCEVSIKHEMYNISNRLFTKCETNKFCPAFQCTPQVASEGEIFAGPLLLKSYLQNALHISLIRRSKET